jgi:hypothetical protein
LGDFLSELGDFFHKTSGHTGPIAQSMSVRKRLDRELNRVARLGEFSHFGRLFSFGSFCENYGSSTHNLSTFSTVTDT